MRSGRPGASVTPALVVILFVGLELLTLLWVFTVIGMSPIPVLTREWFWFGEHGVDLQTLLMGGNTLLLLFLWFLYRFGGVRRPLPFVVAAASLALAQGVCWWLSGGTRWILSVVGTE